MAYETILYSVEEGVATLTLNRPEVQNGFNIPVCDEIMAAIEEANQDASVKFLVINANGKVFSVGGDLDQMQKAVAVDDVQSLDEWAHHLRYGSFRAPFFTIRKGCYAGQRRWLTALPTLPR